MNVFRGREEGDKDYRTPINRLEIGNVLRYLFNLSGKRLAPPEMDVDTVKPVIDIAGGGFLNYEIQSMTNNGSIAGAVNAVTIPLDPNNPISAALMSSTKARNQNTENLYCLGQTFVGPQLQWDARLLLSNFSLLFDNAGSIAFAGKYITVKATLGQPAGAGNPIDIWQGKAAFSIATGRLSYNGSLLNGFVSLPNQGSGLQGLGGWNRFVPFGCTYYITFSSDDGTVFPTNTTLQIDCMAMMTPKGVQSPW